MKNTQLKGVATCIIILIISMITAVIAMDKGYYAIAFIGIFTALSNFVISFLFVGRAKCMAKMLNGKDLIVAWEYPEAETIKNMLAVKEENKGLWIMAIPVFSIVIIVVLLTVGFASGFIGFNIMISITIILLNMIFFKFYIREDSGKSNEGKDIIFKEAYRKMRYVYISSTGIYANGMLHMWKGWGSRLKELQYDSGTKKLSFTYSYLRPYGLGRYTVVVNTPDEKEVWVQAIKEKLLVNINER